MASEFHHEVGKLNVVGEQNTRTFPVLEQFKFKFIAKGVNIASLLYGPRSARNGAVDGCSGMLFDIIFEALVRLGIEGIVIFGDTDDFDWMLEFFSNSTNSGLWRAAVFNEM